jgi:hypothetical protein
VLTRYLVAVRIAESALKHGVVDQDMLHATRNAIRIARHDEFTMLIGPGTEGQLLEVGILDLERDDPVIIHAMSVRPNLL